MVRPTALSPCPISRNDVYDSDPLGWFTVTDYRRFDGCGDPAESRFLEVDHRRGGCAGAVSRRHARNRRGDAHLCQRAGPGADRQRPHRSALTTCCRPHPVPATCGSTSTGASATSPLGDQCKIEGDGNDVVLDMKGRINDEHFWKYDLRWSGGFVVGAHPVTVAADLTEFDDGRPDLNGGGTQPPTSITVPLKTGFNLTAAYAAVATAQSVPPALPDVCGFTVHFRAWGPGDPAELQPSEQPVHRGQPAHPDVALLLRFALTVRTTVPALRRGDRLAPGGPSRIAHQAAALHPGSPRQHVERFRPVRKSSSPRRRSRAGCGHRSRRRSARCRSAAGNPVPA